MRQQGLNAPQYLANANDAAFMKKDGGFFQGSVVISLLAPVTTKPQFPALKQYAAQMKKLGKPTTENSEIGWVNADNFVTGLKMVGPNFTRAKVVDELNTLTDYTANGMLTPIDWTKQHTDKHYPRSCTAFMQVKDSKLVSVWAKPGKPFLCWTGADKTTSVTKVKPVAQQ